MKKQTFVCAREQVIVNYYIIIINYI